MTAPIHQPITPAPAKRMKTHPTNPFVGSYYGHRHYNPSTGRWLSRDPIENVIRQKKGREFKPLQDSPNSYLFVRNNGLNYTDIEGLMSYNPLGWPIPPNNPWQRLKEACPVDRCSRAINEARASLGNIGNDARAHCAFSCTIAKACGQRIAHSLGTIKESRDLTLGAVEWTLSWVLPKSWEEAVNDKLGGGNIDDSAKDYFANDVGLDIAKSGQDCVTECEKQFGSEPPADE